MVEGGPHVAAEGILLEVLALGIAEVLGVLLLGRDEDVDGADLEVLEAGLVGGEEVGVLLSELVLVIAVGVRGDGDVEDVDEVVDNVIGDTGLHALDHGWHDLLGGGKVLDDGDLSMPDGRLVSGDIRELELPVGGELTVDLFDGNVEDGVSTVDAADVNLKGGGGYGLVLVVEEARKEVNSGGEGRGASELGLVSGDELAAELRLPDLEARDLTLPDDAVGREADLCDEQ